MSRSRRLVLCFAVGGLVPARFPAQQLRHITLDLSRGEIDRRYLPAADSFLFVVRISSELRELRGKYSTEQLTTDLASWPRAGTTRSRDATLPVFGLKPGVAYRFEFTLVRRATGNEARLIEARAVNVLRREFRSNPLGPLEGVAAPAAPRVKAALDSVLPRASPRPGSPFTGLPADLMTALARRGVDLLQQEYRRQDSVVGALREEFTAARRELFGAPTFATTIDRISAGLDRAGGFAELRTPLGACRAVREEPPPDGLDIASDSDQLATLLALKHYHAVLGDCRALLRDVRLPQYRQLQVRGAREASDLLYPLQHRLEAFRAETERLLSLWRRRDGALGQVGTDLRRGLDTEVTTDSTVTATFLTAPRLEIPPKTSLGLGLAAVWAPCTTDTDCLRIVPQVTINFRLQNLLSAELGLTLAKTDAPDVTEPLFWFASGIVGANLRLGETRSQRIGAGVVIMRKADSDGVDSFRLGGYLSLTLLDFRL